MDSLCTFVVVVNCKTLSWQLLTNWENLSSKCVFFKQVKITYFSYKSRNLVMWHVLLHCNFVLYSLVVLNVLIYFYVLVTA